MLNLPFWVAVEFSLAEKGNFLALSVDVGLLYDTLLHKYPGSLHDRTKPRERVWLDMLPQNTLEPFIRHSTYIMIPEGKSTSLIVNRFLIRDSH